MRTASVDLTNLINNSNQFYIADLVTITTVNGLVLRYTSADINIVHSGNTFTPFSFDRGNITVNIGTSVDGLSLKLHCGINDL
ncbi:DUF2163 domain-containing protein, partial [Lacticaseibacillus paracasei]